VIDLLLVDDWLLFHLDINERYYPLGQFVLWSLDDNDEFLILTWTNFHRDFLLKFFAHWVFNEPAVKLIFTVFDNGSIFVSKRQLFSIVLSEDGISQESVFFGNRKSDELVLITHI